MPPRRPDWKFGYILERRGWSGKVKVMFMRWDEDPNRTTGGGALQFVGMRLDNNDRTSHLTDPIGKTELYSLPGFRILEDDKFTFDTSPFPTAPFPVRFAHGSGGRDPSIFGSKELVKR